MQGLPHVFQNKNYFDAELCTYVGLRYYQHYYACSSFGSQGRNTKPGKERMCIVATYQEAKKFAVEACYLQARLVRKKLCYGGCLHASC